MPFLEIAMAVKKCLLAFAMFILAFSCDKIFGAEVLEQIRFDFETGDLQGWEVVEGQFDYLVSDRPEFHNRYAGVDRRYNKQGHYYLSTVEQQPGQPSNDRMTGVVESPVFVLNAAVMTFLVGGGRSPQSYVALCTLDGTEVLRVHGRDTEIMRRVTWDQRELVGKAVFLRLVDRTTAGWGHITFDDFLAEGRLAPKLNQQRIDEREKARLKEIRGQLLEQCMPLRAAITDLRGSFGSRYAQGRQFLQRLNTIEQAVVHADAASLITLKDRFKTLYREALIANPLVSAQPILFVTRHQYRSHYHAVDMLFHTGEYNVDRNIMQSDLFQGPGALKTLDLAGGAEVETLVQTPDGVVRDPQLHFNGRRIVFALRRNADEDYHIWEINTDGSGLRQLTRAEGVSDFDPIYLPDDSIVFSSTREPKYNMCSRDSAANLFRMEADGANIHQITKNTLFDNHSELMRDGRILYARWEYVDRNFGDAHGLWTVNPDGTNQAVYWGNNTAVPGAVFNAHEIPGTQQIICVLGPHHDRLWGALAIIDRRLGLDGREPVLRTWPEDAINVIRAGGAFDCDLYTRHVRLKYEDPWPLSDSYFLCSRMTGQGEQTGIYLLDVFGNELLLHTEAPGCYDPMPVKASVRPLTMAARREFDARPGQFYVADVYQGTHMAGVKRGSAKWLRVVESPEKRHWSRGSWNGQGYTAPAMNWHSLENKRILGTVPVAADGSAYFTVPAETFVYFQLLDENGMMIQSMRSGTLVQPGETTGCIGCHDQRLGAPRTVGTRTSLAMQGPPHALRGWHGPARLFSFAAEVQPVLDRHCIECHDYGKGAGAGLNLCGDRTLVFNTAYMELWHKGQVKCVGAGPAPVQAAYSWGAHASGLIKAIRGQAIPEHQNLALSPEDLDRLITWVDLNAVYYPSYACAYPESQTGRTPINREQMARLATLCDLPLAQMMNHATNRGAQVSFDRPELSPCLRRISDKTSPAFQEALAIIRAGQAMLAQRARADMPGFEPCAVDQTREQKYSLRQRIERKNRRAIRSGQRVYD